MLGVGERPSHPHSPISLAEDTYTSEELVDQQPVLLKVMDTADQVRGRAALPVPPAARGRLSPRSSRPQDGPGNCERYLCWANAFLVVYSIDDRESFEGCRRYLDVLARHARGCQHESPVLLLGNKLDMEQYRYPQPLLSRWGIAHGSLPCG